MADIRRICPYGMTDTYVGDTGCRACRHNRNPQGTNDTKCSFAHDACAAQNPDARAGAKRSYAVIQPRTM